jgi:hypothetical protein
MAMAELPHMDDYQAGGTIAAIQGDLRKALEDFEEKVPEDLKGKTFRPEGTPGIDTPQITFPSQYVMYD